MRNCRKHLSLCIVLAMLAALLTYPLVFGNTEQTYEVLVTEDFEGDTNALDSNCVNETFEGQNAGKVSKSSAVLDVEDVYSGGVKLSYDVYAKGATGSNVNCTIIANPAANASSAADCNILQIFQRRIRYVTGNGDNIYAGDNGWHHLEQILNLGDGTVKTKIYTMDGKLLAEGEETVGCSSVGAITFKSISTNMDFYMDNVKVETCDPTETPVEPPVEEPDEPSKPDVYLSEDFEGDTNAFSSNCSNVEFEGADGKVGAVVYNPAGSGQYLSTLDFEDISEGGVKISYDIYLVGGQSHYVKANPISGTEYPLVQIEGLNIKLTNGGTVIYTAGAANWVHIEQIIKLETGSVQTWVYSMSGELLGDGINIAGCDSIKNIVFCNWSAASKINLYLDNVLIENYDIPPELSKSAFTITDYAGNVLEGTRELTPGISSVAMNFGTKMNGNTLSDIILQKEDGTTVTTTGTLSGMVYTLTLGQGLEPNSSYKVVVPATVESSGGVLLGSRFTHTFTTGAGETAVAVTGITKDGSVISGLSQLAAGDTAVVSVGYGNLTGKALPVTCVVAYYSGKSMTGLEAYTISAPTGFGMLTQNITLPSLSGVDKIKVVALNGLYSLIAYHLPITLQ